MNSLETSQQLGTLYWIERLVSNPIKWTLLVTGIGLLSYWNWESLGPTPAAAFTLAAYAALNVVFTFVFARATLSLRAAKVLALVSYAFDFLFVGYLIFGLGGNISSLAFLMYVLLIFKAGLYYPVLKESLLVLPLAIVFYVILLYWQRPDLYFEASMKPRLALLLVVPAVTIYTARLFARREQDVYRLNHRLRENTVELRRQAKELQAVIQGMHDGLLVSDAQLSVVALNPVARMVLRLPPGEEPPLKLGDAGNGQPLRDIVSEALNTPEGTARREIQLPLPNAGEDEPRCYQAVASYITGESETGDQVVVILRDITEERQLEDAKSNFLSVISHELRTPLNSIKGFLNIILEGRAGALNELQRDFLDTASGQAEYLNVMISDLVEFSRIQVRRTELANDPVSMGDVAGSVAGRLLPLASEKQITIVNEVASDVSLVDGDRLRLDQVVSNLVSNAIKFTPSGGVVTLSAEEQDGHLVLSVADTGVGIPADERERIFEPFYQVSHGSARLYGGLGLGLAICKHIVDCHGGRILVESEEGRGSVFRVVLPLHQVREAAPSFELALRT